MSAFTEEDGVGRLTKGEGVDRLVALQQVHPAGLEGMRRVTEGVTLRRGHFLNLSFGICPQVCTGQQFCPSQIAFGDAVHSHYFLVKVLGRDFQDAMIMKY